MGCVCNYCTGLCIRSPTDASPRLLDLLYQHVLHNWTAHSSWCPGWTRQQSHSMGVSHTFRNTMGTNVIETEA